MKLITLTCKNKTCPHKIEEGRYINISADGLAWIYPLCEEINSMPDPFILGKKNDKGKLDWALLPLVSIKEVIKVLMWGEKNYDRDNWQLVENHRIRYYNAAIRHMTDWFEGRKKDADTKLHPLAHVVCCMLFLIWFDKKGKK